MAISTLLGGFRVWVPNEQGKPLHKGRASFFVAGTNTPAVVYKDQACTVPWGTQVYVDNQGYIGDSENGVWLKTDKLYKVVVEKKTCSDPEEWTPLWKIDGAGFYDEDEARGEQGISTISIVESYAYLKALTPGQFDYVFVAGFYNPGDTGEPMCFRWVADKTITEDNGAYVKPTAGGQGAWEQMFNSGEIDVRKFGAIPDMNQYVDSNILDAMNYAVEPRTVSVEGTIYQPKTILFSKAGKYKVAGSIDFTEFKMISSYNSLRAGIVVSEGVVFDAPGKTITFGSGHIIKSATNIVSSGTNLRIETKSMEYVRPQWFGLDDTDASYTKAVNSGNNVFVYGDKYSSFYFNFAADVNIKNKLSINENTVITDDGSALLFKRNGTEILKFNRNGFSFTGKASFSGDIDAKNVNGEEATFDSVDCTSFTSVNALISGSFGYSSSVFGSYTAGSFEVVDTTTYQQKKYYYDAFNVKEKSSDLKIFSSTSSTPSITLSSIFGNAAHGDVVSLLLYGTGSSVTVTDLEGDRNLSLGLNKLFVFETYEKNSSGEVINRTKHFLKA